MLGGGLAAFGPLLAQLLGGGQMPMETAGPGGIAGPISGSGTYGGGPNPDGSMSLTGTPSDANSDASEAVVQGWKPPKRSTLGFLGDVLLGAFGAPPAFGQRKQRQGVQEAMQGFTHDPLESIQRLAQIPGQQDKAWALYNQYMDNSRADRIAGRQEDLASLKYMGKLGGMLNNIRNSKDPAAVYERSLPMIRKFAETYNLPIDGLGDQYDETAVGNYIMQNVDVDDQVKIEQLGAYREARLNQINRSLDHREYVDSEKLEDADATRNQRGEIAAANEAGRNARDNDGGLKGKYGGRAYKDANGTLVEFNKDGNKMKAVSPNGMIHMYSIRVNGEKVRVWSGTQAEYDAKVAAAKGK